MKNENSKIDPYREAWRTNIINENEQFYSFIKETVQHLESTKEISDLVNRAIKRHEGVVGQFLKELADPTYSNRQIITIHLDEIQKRRKDETLKVILTELATYYSKSYLSLRKTWNDHFNQPEFY